MERDNKPRQLPATTFHFYCSCITPFRFGKVSEAPWGGSTEGGSSTSKRFLTNLVIYLTVTVTCCQDDTFCDSCMKMQPTSLFQSGSISQKGPTHLPGQASAIQAAEKVSSAGAEPKVAPDFTRLTVSLKRDLIRRRSFSASCIVVRRPTTNDR